MQSIRVKSRIFETHRSRLAVPVIHRKSVAAEVLFRLNPALAAFTLGAQS
jgi:hypothetical protein